jgi:PAS domain S-box-containing protein
MNYPPEKDKADQWHGLINQVVRHDPIGVAIFNTDLQFMYVSEHFLEDYKVSESDVIGKYHYEVFPEIPEKWRAVHRRTLQGEIHSRDDDWFERPDGSIDHTRWECRPWYKTDGSIGGMILYTEVINERKRIETELNESRWTFSTLFYGNPNPIFLSQPETGELVDVNDAYAKILGYLRHELIGRSCSDPEIWTAGPDSWNHLVSEVAKHGQVTGREAELRTRDGAGLNVLISTEPVPIRGEQLLLSVLTNITQQKKAMEEIHRLVEEKELLLREVHHRVKNNMNTMTSLLFLQSNTLTDPVARQALSDAGSRIQSMQVLYDTLHRSSNIQEVSVREYLKTLVDEVISVFPSSERVKTVVDLEECLLKTRTMASVGLIVNELITNAMKHAFADGKPGSLEVLARCRDDNGVRITVQDDGSGLPEDFDPDKINGFGLGLVRMVCDQIAARFSITAANPGTCAVIEIPGHSIL